MIFQHLFSIKIHAEKSIDINLKILEPATHTKSFEKFNLSCTMSLINPKIPKFHFTTL